MRRLIIAVLFGLLAMPMFGSELSAQTKPRSQGCILRQPKEGGPRFCVDTVTKHDTTVVEKEVVKHDTTVVEKEVGVPYNPPIERRSSCGAVCKSLIGVGVLATGTAVYCLAIDKNHCHRSKVEVDNSNSVVVNGVSRMRVLPYVGRQRFGVSGSFSFGR